MAVPPAHSSSDFPILVLAASRGGLEALKTLLAAFPPDLEAAVFIVVHIGDHPSILPQILGRHCRLPVIHPEHGQPLRPGIVCVAPPDRHLVLSEDRIQLSAGPKEHHTRPAADPLFRSAAETFGPRVIGVVLTGGDSDGAQGLSCITRHGGIGVVEEPEGAEAREMPQNAIKEDSPQFQVPADALGQLLVRLVQQGPERP